MVQQCPGTYQCPDANESDDFFNILVVGFGALVKINSLHFPLIGLGYTQR